MSGTLSKSHGLYSALKMEEETIVTNKQGIVSILGSDGERPITKAASLRRTLSADMSSKKWLTQNGFSPMKKIASSEEFSVAITDSFSEEEDECEERKGQLDTWTSIQEKKTNEENEKPGHFDIWSSIISQKAQEDTSKSLPPPYIHPLVKRSASSLSEKSLQICTESLGSETGSDGFSSYPSSENGDVEEDKEEEEELQHGKQDYEEPRVLKYNYTSVGKKSPQRSFPPPIPSLSRSYGAAVRMTTRRDNGRLVMEAVSVPSQNNFHAQRQDGRLVLTFANTVPEEAEPNDRDETDEQVKELDELVEEFDNLGEEMEIEEDDEDEGFVTEEVPKFSSGAINLHRLALMINKPIGLANRKTAWPNKFNEIVEFEEEEKIDPTPHVAQSLPPVARMMPPPQSTVAGAAASFNDYEFFWRPKHMTKASSLNPNPNVQHLTPLKKPKNEVTKEHQLRGKNSLTNGCKEPRRSLTFWEPHCIATS